MSRERRPTQPGLVCAVVLPVQRKASQGPADVQDKTLGCSGAQVSMIQVVFIVMGTPSARDILRHIKSYVVSWGPIPRHPVPMSVVNVHRHHIWDSPHGKCHVCLVISLPMVCSDLGRVDPGALLLYHHIKGGLAVPRGQTGL
jgi:hypothetical protein